MKGIITLFIGAILFSACSKKDSTPEKTTGTYTFMATYNKSLTTGQVVQERQPLAFLFIWKADNRDFEIKSVLDLGYAFDKISQTSLKYDFVISNPSTESGELLPGRYFIYIVTGADAFPRNMYSYTYFDIKAGQLTQIKKVFRDQNNFAYESW